MSVFIKLRRVSFVLALLRRNSPKLSRCCNIHHFRWGCFRCYLYPNIHFHGAFSSQLQTQINQIAFGFFFFHYLRILWYRIKNLDDNGQTSSETWMEEKPLFIYRFSFISLSSYLKNHNFYWFYWQREWASRSNPIFGEDSSFGFSFIRLCIRLSFEFDFYTLTASTAQTTHQIKCLENLRGASRWWRRKRGDTTELLKTKTKKTHTTTAATILSTNYFRFIQCSLFLSEIWNEVVQ